VTHRALGLHRRRPCGKGFAKPGYRSPLVRHDSRINYQLPSDWWEQIPATIYPEWVDWRVRDTRREAEDAAALAFAELPAERRTELLAGKGAEERAAKRKNKPRTQLRAKGEKKAKPKKGKKK
jgi:hypothetical protein